MNLIEERIRAAARAAADTVAPQSVPPLELPAARPRRFGRGRQGTRSPRVSWTPWLARLTPVAAALAVAAILITIVQVSPPAYQGGPDSVTSTAARPDIPLGPPASAYVRSGQVPRYFVTLTPSAAAVHLTAGGATVATIRPARPAGTIVAVASAGDGQTFVLADQDPETVTFYQVRLDSSGQPGALTQLPMSVAAGKTFTGLALSPDGTRLAIAVASRNGGGVQQIRLYPVHGGAARIWSATGGTIGGGPYGTRSLSWPASQRTLAFNWSAGQTASVRLLDIGSGGGSLLAASHPVVTIARSAGKGQTLYQCRADMIIIPNGSAIACASSTITKIAKDGVITYSTGFPEFSVATGRLIRIVGHWPQKQNDTFTYDLFWSGASGQVVIGMIHSASRDWVGIISGNRFTALNDQRSLGAYAVGTW